MIVNWLGAQFNRDIENQMDKRLKKAGIVVVDETKRLLGVQGNPSKALKMAGARVTHSKPGEPPRWQTKTLRKSIARERAGYLKEHVGTNVEYAAWLELGTPHGQMKARPYLRPALARSQKKIVRILTEPMK